MSRHGGWQQLGDDAASVAPSRGVSDISGVELGSVLSEQHQVPRDTLDDSLCSDVLHAVLCGLVIVAAVFGAHWLVVLSSSHSKHKSHHHWAGTDAVSNNVRLEVEKKWLGGQKTLPTGAVVSYHSKHHGNIDAISAHQFQAAVERLQGKMARATASAPPASSSLLVPIDRISGSRGGNLGLNHIPQFGDGAVRQGGGEVEEDQDGVWVPRTDEAHEQTRPPGRARLPLQSQDDWGQTVRMSHGGNPQAGLDSPR